MMLRSCVSISTSNNISNNNTSNNNNLKNSCKNNCNNTENIVNNNVSKNNCNTNNNVSNSINKINCNNNDVNNNVKNNVSKNNCNNSNNVSNSVSKINCNNNNDNNDVSKNNYNENNNVRNSVSKDNCNNNINNDNINTTSLMWGGTSSRSLVWVLFHTQKSAFISKSLRFWNRGNMIRSYSINMSPWERMPVIQLSIARVWCNARNDTGMTRAITGRRSPSSSFDNPRTHRAAGGRVSLLAVSRRQRDGGGHVQDTLYRPGQSRTRAASSSSSSSSSSAWMHARRHCSTQHCIFSNN